MELMGFGGIAVKTAIVRDHTGDMSRLEFEFFIGPRPGNNKDGRDTAKFWRNFFFQLGGTWAFVILLFFFCPAP